MTESAAQERIYVSENYLVAFLDVLGQSDKFGQLRLPKTAEEHAAVQETMSMVSKAQPAISKVLASLKIHNADGYKEVVPFIDEKGDVSPFQEVRTTAFTFLR
jgi:hypothetical protein